MSEKQRKKELEKRYSELFDAWESGEATKEELSDAMWDAMFHNVESCEEALKRLGFHNDYDKLYIIVEQASVNSNWAEVPQEALEYRTITPETDCLEHDERCAVITALRYRHWYITKGRGVPMPHDTHKYYESIYPMYEILFEKNDSEVLERIKILKTHRDNCKRQALEYAGFAVNVLENTDFDVVQKGLTEMTLYTCEKTYPINELRINNFQTVDLIGELKCACFLTSLALMLNTPDKESIPVSYLHQKDRVLKNAKLIQEHIRLPDGDLETSE